MVTIKDVRESNLAFKLSGHASTMVAVFVGATSGIGMGTLKQYAKYAQGGKAYIVGRSKTAAQPLLDELKASDPNGTFDFIEAEISLIKNVDIVCEAIKAKEKKVDILFMSPGFLAVGGRIGLSIHALVHLIYNAKLYQSPLKELMFPTLSVTTRDCDSLMICFLYSPKALYQESSPYSREVKRKI
jgi:NAD(P)-dependent dehydrogenase (short-subunit alcohol dehydrogenase family)